MVSGVMGAVAAVLLVAFVATASGLFDFHQHVLSRMENPNQALSPDSFKQIPSNREPLRSRLEAASREGLPKRLADSNVGEPRSLYSLIPGRYPQARSLPSVLSGLPDTPEGRQVVETLIQFIKNRTGISVPERWVDLALNDSYALTNMARMSPTDFHEIAISVNLELGASNSTVDNPLLPSGFIFPQNISTFAVNMADYIPSIGPIGAGLYLGFFFPNTTSYEQAKINTVTSFIFNQLSYNSRITPDDSQYFVLRFNNKDITSVEQFLDEILSNPSATINTYVTKRIAAFFGLYVKTPQNAWLEVADPLMVATGYYDVGGTTEAILPAIHSEWVIEVNMPGINFNIVWYLGDNGVGYFPGNMYVLESWVGVSNGPVLAGKEGVRAVQFMSLLGDILAHIYAVKHLALYGYLITGVCDDACGAIEMLTYGASTEYPNQIIRSFVIPEILHRIQKRDSFSHYYYDLLTVISSMPEDWTESNDSTAPARALGTIVWPVGKEPFECVVESRTILSQLVGEQNNLSPIS